MNMNQSLTIALNDAITKHGFRVSPRMSLGDRLARYTQLYYESKGRWVDEDDSRAAASMLMMKYGDKNEKGHQARTDKIFNDPPATPRRTEGHSMTRRSQVASHQ